MQHSIFQLTGYTSHFVSNLHLLSWQIQYEANKKEKYWLFSKNKAGHVAGMNILLWYLISPKLNIRTQIPLAKPEIN